MSAEARSAQFLGFLWVFLAVLMAACFALGFKRFAAEVPWSWERRLHRLVGPLGAGPRCPGSPEALAAVDKLVARLFPIYPADNAIPLSIEFVRDSRVNAFATFAGHVYVNSGLLDDLVSGEELAGVLAHEISHVVKRDVIEGTLAKVIWFEALHVLTGSWNKTDARLFELFLNLRFTREQEDEADEMALKRLRDAQIDSRELAHFFLRLSDREHRPEFISDHPAPDARVERFNIDPGVVLPILKKAEWDALRAICTPTKVFSK